MKKLIYIMMAMLTNITVCMASQTHHVFQANMKDGTVVEYYVLDISKVRYTPKTTTILLEGEEVTIPSADIDHYTFKSVYALYDGDIYSGPSADVYDEIHYFRTFDDTKWQSLYVPFTMSYDDWKDNFEIGSINNVSVEDKDNDGTPDAINVDITIIQSGSINPNTPYVIRAKEAGAKVIAIENATLSASEENSTSFSSSDIDFKFTGTYKGVSAYNMYENQHFAFISGSLICANNLSSGIMPMRWYMSTELKDGTHLGPELNENINIIDVTGIADVAVTSSKDRTYSIDSRLVNNQNLKAGIYICNGKKFIVK